MTTASRGTDGLKRLFISLLVILCFPVESHGKQSSTAVSADRPRIGVALSGGGARGAAHVGVLRVLEEMRVPIDYIAGTSMGAIIGGLYASGTSTAELEAVLSEMDWDAVFTDYSERPERSFRRKQDDRLYLTKLKPGIKDGGVKIQTALIQGQKFDLTLSRLTRHAWSVKDFDDLPIPFRAVATDIATGEEVVLGGGDLATAIRASMSVPAAFAAVEIDGRMLVDGGISNNMPISVVREMGADIIIAVDISTPLSDKEGLKSALDIVGQLSSFLTRNNSARQLATLSDRDILIVPAFDGELGSADFEKVLEAIEIGRHAADSMRGDLARLSYSDAQFSAHLTDRRTEKQPSVVNFVRFENNSDVSDELLAHHLGIEPGEPLDLDRLEEGVGRVYGLDVFSSVGYELVEENGRDGIVIHAEEKPWGTSYLQLGIELSADTNAGDSAFNIAGSYTHIPLNERMGEWRTVVQFGEEPTIATEVYQPLDVDSNYSAYARLGYFTRNFRIFDGDVPSAEYQAGFLGLDAALALNIGTWGELRGGYRYQTGDVDIVSGLPALDDYGFDVGEAYLRLSIDKLDNINFPTQGIGLTLEGSVSARGLGSDYDYERISLSFGGAKSYGRNTFLSSLIYQTTLDDDAPFERLFRLGGYRRLSGLQKNQLAGQHAGLVGVGFQRLLYPNKIAPIYAGATLELGNTWMDSSDIGFDGSLLAGSLSLGADTPLGPLSLAYGHAEGGNESVYLFLGSPWFR